MPDAGGGTCLAQETKLCRFVTQISFANDLQGHRTPEIDVEGLVSDAHGTATQLDRFPVFVHHQFIVLKALDRLFR